MPIPASPTALRLRPANRAAVWAIGRYRRATASRAHRCLHWPTCSNYGLIAYEKYGFWKATGKTWRRVRQCHPFSTLPYEDFP
ncbi:MAG: putative rane protein insertion efficiency factor [Thermoplasmata archaeon]|jgi:putative component of membrane protein insertase Oxa1/YidC/SpoIIIJ protein YidD|nr:putative rane protein insertion efficiency factor [Thermoplasmata archaeon]